MFKSGFVSIVGRPNVGKSTLMNNVIGEKIAIMSDKPQTTRNLIQGVYTKDDTQIVFIDTPGIHKPVHKLGNKLNYQAYYSANDVDVIALVMDASEEIGRGDRRILDKIIESKKPCILVINKIDLVEKEKLLNLINIYSKEYDFKAVVPISASKSDGTDNIINELLKLLPNGPKYYADDEYTDQTMRQIAEETIREKALKLLEDEVPHGIYVEVEKFKNRKTTKGEEIYDIDATIYCIRESHKGIIIGKGGSLLKKIATYARQDLEKMLETKVNLKVWVKVKPDWQDQDAIVNKFKLK